MHDRTGKSVIFTDLDGTIVHYPETLEQLGKLIPKDNNRTFFDDKVSTILP